MEGLSKILNEQNAPVSAKVKAKICNPQPGECTSEVTDSQWILICNGPGWTNCVTPQVGDYMISTAVDGNCQTTIGQTTSWEITKIEELCTNTTLP